jgi:hypothetical protein
MKFWELEDGQKFRNKEGTFIKNGCGWATNANADEEQDYSLYDMDLYAEVEVIS